MFIICPKCGAKYQIPEGTTLENGQKLKCSACDHLFLKGEESPLVLDKVAPSESDVKPASKAFSKPLYTMDDSPEKTAAPIPEVFQPLPESKPKKSGLWIIPIYIILLILLCVAGWKFRDFLKPSFSAIIPPPEKPTPALTLPQVQPDPIPAPVLEKPESVPVAEPQKPLPPEPVIVKPTVLPNPLPPVAQPVAVPSTEPIPTPKVETNIQPASELPLPPEESDIEPLPDDNQPLFELGSPVIPITIQVQDVSYKVEPDETGIPQLLVNGNLQNLKNEIQSVPLLTLFVYDAQDQLLAQKEIHLTTDILAPAEVIPFYTSLTPAPNSVARVEVRP